MSAALETKAAPIVAPVQMRTYRIEIESTRAVLRVGLLAERLAFQPGASDPAEFTNIGQAHRALVHAQKKLDAPFGAIGALPLAKLAIVPKEWASIEHADVWDAGNRIKQTAIEAALLDLEGAPSYMAPVRSARAGR